MNASRAGYVALLGRPNVGKSTLLNRLLERKLSITAPQPQTTRHAIIGIRTLADTQIVYVDTPGLHLNARRAINRYMNRVAGGVLGYVDVVVLVVEALRWRAEDEAVLQRLVAFSGPVLLAVNKVDRVADKSRLLPFLQMLGEKRPFAAVVPLSALKHDNIAPLEERIAAALPVSEFLYPDDQLTTHGESFLAAELVREKLIRRLSQELPYSLTVEIETFAERDSVLHVGAVIWLERPSQKGIVIGAQGAVLKEVGRQAREAMEKLFQRKVFLRTWVKVRTDWADDEQALRRFGYLEEV